MNRYGLALHGSGHRHRPDKACGSDRQRCWVEFWEPGVRQEDAEVLAAPRAVLV